MFVQKDVDCATVINFQQWNLIIRQNLFYDRFFFMLGSQRKRYQISDTASWTISENQEATNSIPGPVKYHSRGLVMNRFLGPVSPYSDINRAVVSYWRKHKRLVLVQVNYSIQAAGVLMLSRSSPLLNIKRIFTVFIFKQLNLSLSD